MKSQFEKQFDGVNQFYGDNPILVIAGTFTREEAAARFSEHEGRAVPENQVEAGFVRFGIWFDVEGERRQGWNLGWNHRGKRGAKSVWYWEFQS